MGKTSLVRELQRRMAETGDFEVVFVDLEAATDPADAIAEIGYPLRSRDVNMLGWRTRHPIPKAGSTTRAP